MSKNDKTPHVSEAAQGSTNTNCIVMLYKDDGVSPTCLLHPTRKRRNPSFSKSVAPHCTIKPRYCYCVRDGQIVKCEVGKFFKDVCNPTPINPRVFSGVAYETRRNKKKLINSEFFSSEFTKKLEGFRRLTE